MKKTDLSILKRNLKEMGMLAIETRGVFRKVMDLEFRVGIFKKEKREKKSS